MQSHLEKPTLSFAWLMSFSKQSSSSDLGVQNTVDELVAELFHLLGQGQVTCFKFVPKKVCMNPLPCFISWRFVTFLPLKIPGEFESFGCSHW